MKHRIIKKKEKRINKNLHKHRCWLRIHLLVEILMFLTPNRQEVAEMNQNFGLDLNLYFKVIDVSLGEN